MHGRKKLATIQAEFSTKFPYLTLLFLDKRRRAMDSEQTLAAVRTTKGEDLSIVGHMKVATFEARCLASFGITVEVAYLKDGELVRSRGGANEKTLSGLNAWCAEQGYTPIGSAPRAKRPPTKGARTPEAPASELTGDEEAMLRDGMKVLGDASIGSAVATFTTIATATGILTRQHRREPEPDERDALWEVVRAFAERLYALDIDPEANQEERNVLAHFAVVALHWCDIYVNDPRHKMDDGRFRRDTLALALCLFARVTPSYRWYEVLKRGWIAPHVNFSYLIWTLQSIVQCNTDNLFHRFAPEEARRAQDQKSQMNLDSWAGYIPVEDEPEDSPLHRIWVAVRDGVLGPDGPHQFALNYIWSSASLPGGMGLLSEDREMNKAYLQGVVSGDEAVGPPSSPSPEAPRYLSAPNEYPGTWYLPNAHWNDDGMMLRIKSFPNIFAGGQVSKDQLFRRFTTEEVDRIARKIRAEKTLIYLPFVRKALAERFDVRGMKPPFWFIPFVAFGNDRGGILYFEENGFYTNYESPESLDSTGHVDLMDQLSVTSGYNGLNDSDEDDAVLSSLCIEGHSQAGAPRTLNIVEFHGEGYGATLRIALAIWEAAWQGVVDRSRGGSAFMKGPPPGWESFDSWDELLAWADEPPRERAPDGDEPTAPPSDGPSLQDILREAFKPVP